MEIKTILTGFIILVVFIVLYRFFFVDPTASELLSLAAANQSIEQISSTKLGGNANSVDFSYSFWIYVKDWNTKLGMKKVIIRRKGIDTSVAPEIYLDKNTNDLKIDMSVYSETTGSGSSSNTTIQSCVVKNIPLQKWTHIIVTTNNRALDTYIDGKLVKTCILTGNIALKGSSPVDICPNNGSSSENGYDGYIAKVRYFSRTLNPREVYEIYKQGYSGSLFGTLLNKYRLRLSYIKDNQEVGALEI